MKCIVCGNELVETFHKGTRDNPKIDVMRCAECRSLQLSSFEQIQDGFYEDGNMRKDQYSISQDMYSDTVWESWLEETKEDDYRRVKMLERVFKGGGGIKVLDFGCGNGGFLRVLRQEGVIKNIVGVELDKEAQSRLMKENIEVYDKLDSIDKSVRFDVITMFHVIEHLDNPYRIILDIKSRLKVGGLLIIETPNAEDALISKYHSKSFMDFTFWSAQLFLYTFGSLETLMNRCGFSTVDNGQLQRYSLANHLYWLSEGKPGGHVKWEEFNQKLLNKAYTDVLMKMHICDTLFGIFRKNA